MGCRKCIDNVKGLLKSASILLDDEDTQQYALGLYIYAVEEFGKAILLKKQIIGKKPTLYKIKAEQRHEAISWLSKMRSGKYGCIAEFKRQIEEFEQYKAMFFHLYDTTKSEFLKLKRIQKMSHMTIALVNIYSLLPQIAQNVPMELINNKIDYYKDDKDLSVY